ncbi:carboxylate-amine ligase [Streptomyces albireticuli]|uniref:Putative glutamate--cysteine ligase 2 n=1 Tax=Streptomyces albireticuli TaxID=1940 RepID=A0A2A2DBN8_9ACTN|nr:YbdK family carboxylate-amine ligase [Streptomyces albireticuli]MCD9145463.1 YbdK family carboxylate-amine ligase [Streptomyces albireticuli]MCD9164972.1 YbdK family carboxylate-amine ligase [Streptomyces albireticuli]MCD9195437.1 YbdK family carboxylate-amine ligase [Streptomyces albireticuli]PAU48722.1 carboxylate--amine ligase [Streptomyces albireticuli]
MNGSENAAVSAVQPDGQLPTVGVEEEFFLVGADSRAVEPAGGRVVARAASALGGLVSGEFTDYQIEIRTPPCSAVAQLYDELVRLRAGVARAAAAEGLRACPSGTPVLGPAGPVSIGEDPRYRASVELFGSMMDDYVISAMHVHVHLPDRELAVLVSNHLRPWLPLLVEMSANSPFCKGRDTGYASWRSMIRCRFPCLGPPPYAESFDHYQRTAAAMTEAGAMPFADLPFWDIRLHPRLPTLEVRCMDVPVTPADSAALAAIVRGLVVTASASARRGDSGPRPCSEMLRGAYAHATRDGWTGRGRDALTGEILSAPVRGARLLDHIRPALAAHGDVEVVAAFLGRLARRGSGAHRQRAAARLPGGLVAVVDDLTALSPASQAEEPSPTDSAPASPGRRMLNGTPSGPVSA